MESSAPSEQSLGVAPESRAERPLGLSSSFVYGATLIIQLIGYLSSFEVAGHIVASGAGLPLWGFIQFNLLLASSVNTLGELRLGSSFVYYIARTRSSTKYTGTYFVARTVFVLIAGLALLGLAPSLGLSSASPGLSISSATLFASLAMFMVLPILWTPGTVYGQLYVGLGNSIRAQYPALIDSVIRTALIVAVAFLFPTIGATVDSQAIWGLSGSFVVAAAASAVYSLPTVWRHLSLPRWGDLRHLLAYAWPLIGSLGLQFAVTNAMPILVRAFYEYGAVAVFNAANGFRILLLALPTAVTIPLFPHLTSLHERRELRVLGDRVWRALRYTGMLVVPGAVLFAVYRVNLLLILFPSRAFMVGAPGSGGGAIPLALLALSAIPLTLSQIIGTALNSIGQQRLELYLTLLQVGVLLAGIFVFLSAGGVLGFTGLAAIAFAALLSSVAALVLNAIFLRRLLAIPVRWRPVGTILLAAAAEFFVMSRLNTVVPVNRWYELLGVGVLAMVVYVLVLIAVGELAREDVRIFARSVGLPERVARALSRVCWRENSDGPSPPLTSPTPPSGPST